jgi:hypothetical protein
MKAKQVGTPADAARDADALLLAAQWTRVDDVLAQATLHQARFC